MEKGFDSTAVAVETDGTGFVHSEPDESVTLRGYPSDKSKTGSWKASPFIFALEFGDTVGLLSIALNLVPYLILNLHQSTNKATTTFTNFMGTAYLTPVVWGFLADSYFGRYWTILMGSSIMISGLVLLTLSTVISSLKPIDCIPTATQACPAADGKVMTAFYAAMFLIAIGSGGIKPSLPPLGADQFDDSIPKERRWRPVYFNIVFWFIQIGALFALTAVVYIQDNLGRTKGFAIPAGIFLAMALIFFAGTVFFRHKRPAGSGLTRMAQVLVAAIRKHSAALPANAILLFETPPKLFTAVGRKLAHTRRLRFLDKAAVITDGDVARDGSSISNWRLCSVTQVEEMKRVVYVVPIWLTTIVPYILLAQVSSYTVVQCLTMNRHMGPNFQVPPASFQAFGLVVTAIIVPLYDPYFVPILRKLTGNPRGLSSLQRIGTGLVISIFCMLSAALVELRRKHVAGQHGLLDNPYAQIPISAFYLLPQIMILGITEMFLTVGQLEFFYEEMPDAMRSLGNSLYCSAVSIGYFITSFLVPTVTRLTREGNYGGWLATNINRGDLQNFYWLLMVLSIANTALFLLAAHLYRYKQLDPGSKVGVLDEASPNSSPAHVKPFADQQRLDPRIHGSSSRGPGADQAWLGNV